MGADLFRIPRGRCRRNAGFGVQRGQGGKSNCIEIQKKMNTLGCGKGKIRCKRVQPNNVNRKGEGRQKKKGERWGHTVV